MAFGDCLSAIKNVFAGSRVIKTDSRQLTAGSQSE